MYKPLLSGCYLFSACIKAGKRTDTFITTVGVAITSSNSLETYSYTHILMCDAVIMFEKRL